MNFTKSDTACFSCTKATNGGCSWSRDFQPVDGWQAIQTSNSFRVMACPEFRPEFYEDKDGVIHCRPFPELDTEGTLLILEAALDRVREDYVFGIGQSKDKGTNRATIEAQIRTEYFCTLFQIDDPEEIIAALRKQTQTLGVF